ncbi:MAG: hypothetical protein C4326_08970 [Ignavibacteria bacterium]
MTKPITEDFSNIVDIPTRWAAYNLKDYVIEQEMLCFCVYRGVCKVVVRNGTVIDVIRQSDGVSIITEAGRYKSVELLFSFAESVHPDSVAQLIGQYDARFGFPRYGYIDYDAGVADEELGYRTYSIERVVRWY